MRSPELSAFQLLQKAASLLMYQSVFDFEQEVGQAFLALLQAIHNAQQQRNAVVGDAEILDCLHAYGRWFRCLAEPEQSWQDVLLACVLRDENPFTQQAQQKDFEAVSPALVLAAGHDLEVLQELSRCGEVQLRDWVEAISSVSLPAIAWDQASDSAVTSVKLQLQRTNWAEGVEVFAAHYRQHGTGLAAMFSALRWHQGELVGIAYADPIELGDLVGYGGQQAALLKNTEFLLKGYPALHVLLYGSRGSGKSSLVKALLNRYSQDGLRLVEVAKSELRDLPAIADQLRSLPQKFILFVDDLSFEEDEDDYKALKVVLEGNLTARSQNVVVYATSNRRHLIREFFGDRPHPKDSDEVHAWDTMQEKLSFSDRFGLTLTFEPPDQATYLQIVRHLAAQANIFLNPDDLEFQALQWATRHNGRSGRTARQFIDFLRADLSTV
ncbi:MAG: AAA+ family ATPase [Leptolyngbya sp.]|nr:MAG: AAA+ family ATPase [Leptolyngbya sp.]